MKKITAFIIIILLFHIVANINAQTQDWLWAKSAGGGGNDFGEGICTDIKGNIYLTGISNSKIIFGSDTLKNSSVINMYLVKFNLTGNVLWAKCFGKSQGSIHVCTDLNGNVYVAGDFISSTITLSNYTLKNAGEGDMFIVKYDSTGNVLWAKSAGGNKPDAAHKVNVDINDNVYVTGCYDSSTIIFGKDTLTNSGSSDIFLVKYNSLGNIIWAKSAIGGGMDECLSVITDKHNNIYISGNFWSKTLIFGTDTLKNTGAPDVFLVKYNTMGDVVWANSTIGNDYDFTNCSSIDLNGNIYLTGVFLSSKIIFGNDTLLNSTTYQNGEMFLVKYNSNGEVMWVRKPTGKYYKKGYGVNTDYKGNVYVTGLFQGTAMFGKIELSNVDLNSYDLFIVKYDSLGNVLWAKRAGGSSLDEGFSVCSDMDDNVYITGYFVSPSIIFGKDTLKNVKNDDIFIAKIGEIIDTTYINKSTNINFLFTIYPNPAVDKVYISNNIKDNETATLNVYNLMGTLVKTISLKQKKQTIDIKDLNNGIYMFVVKTEKNIYSNKVIIQK